MAADGSSLAIATPPLGRSSRSGCAAGWSLKLERNAYCLLGIPPARVPFRVRRCRCGRCGLSLRRRSASVAGRRWSRSPSHAAAGRRRRRDHARRRALAGSVLAALAGGISAGYALVIFVRVRARSQVTRSESLPSRRSSGPLAQRRQHSDGAAAGGIQMRIASNDFAARVLAVCFVIEEVTFGCSIDTCAPRDR